MSLKVIGAGLGRTGTFSLKLALEKLLGEPCYHMYEVFQNLDHVALWHAAARGEAVDWQAMMAGFGAAVDWPASGFWEELSAAFPDAIIVLSTRDAEKWWDSAHATIFPSIKREGDNDDRKAWQAMVFEMLDKRFTLEIENKEACIDAFKKHDAYVRSKAPSNRLVVWEAKDGWEPLCTALGVPVPDEPFPVANTKEEFLERVKSH